MMDQEHLKYPAGRYTPQEHFTAELRDTYIKEIEELPTKMSKLIADFTLAEWKESYRVGGWNAAQIVHHVADSHINSYVRFKLAVTEDNPPAKNYEEKLWANLADADSFPVESSLTLLEGLHKRWVIFLRSLSMEDYQRTIFRPESGKQQTLAFLLGTYAWHGRHHLAHLQLIKGAGVKV